MDALTLTVVLSALDKATGPCKKVADELKQVTADASHTRQQLKQLTAQQKDISGFRKMGAELGKLKAQQRGEQDKLRALRQQLIATENPSHNLKEAYKAQLREVRKLDRGYVKYQQRIARTGERLKAAGIDTTRLHTQNLELSRSIKQVTTQLEKQEAVRDKLAQKNKALMEARNRWTSRREGANTAMMAGVGLLASGVGTARGLWRMAQAPMQFEQEMSGVQALTGLTKKDAAYKALREQARHLGATTQFTEANAAQGMQFLAMAGYTPKSIRAAMPGLLNEAAAGGTDLGTTADITSNILGAFHIDPSKTGHVADVLTKSFTTSNTTLEKLGETMSYVGPQAHAAGMSFETTAAMAGLLGNIGIQDSMAGTSLRQMLAGLVAPSGEAAKAMHKLNLRVMDNHGNLRNMVQIIADVGGAIKHMGSGEQLKYLTTIFGKRAGSGMAELVAKSGVGALQKYVNLLHDADGTAERIARVKMDNFGGDLRYLHSAWQNLETTLYESNKPLIRGLVEQLKGMIEGLNKFAKTHPEFTKWIMRLVLAFTAIVTVLGVLLIAFGTALLTMGAWSLAIETSAAMGGKWLIVNKAMRAALWLMKAPLLMASGAIKLLGRAFIVAGRAMLTTPLGWIIMAIAAIAFGAYELIKHWGAVKQFFGNLWGFVKYEFTKFMAWLDTLPAKIAAWAIKVAKYILNPFSAIKDLFHAASSLVGELFGDDNNPKLAVATGPQHALKLPNAATSKTKPPTHVTQHNKFHVEVHPAHGMDEKAVAQQVADAIAEQQRAADRRQRSAMYDVE